MPDVVASQVSVRDLKTHLSEWLGHVQAGDVVEVTSHRRPIARITAVRQQDPVSSNWGSPYFIVSFVVDKPTAPKATEPSTASRGSIAGQPVR